MIYLFTSKTPNYQKYNPKLCRIVNTPTILFGEDDIVEVAPINGGGIFMAFRDELQVVDSVDTLDSLLGNKLEDEDEDDFFDDDEFDDDDEVIDEEDDFDDDFLDDDDEFDSDEDDDDL